MPTLRPLALLLAAAATAACAAGDHHVPEEDDRIDIAHRDSLVTGAAIPATMPFEGSVFPVPPSHHASSSGRGAQPSQQPSAPAHHQAAAPADEDSAAGEAREEGTPEPQPQPSEAPEPTVPEPAAPVVPATGEADAADEHAGHTP